MYVDMYVYMHSVQIEKVNFFFNFLKKNQVDNQPRRTYLLSKKNYFYYVQMLSDLNYFLIVSAI